MAGEGVQLFHRWRWCRLATLHVDSASFGNDGLWPQVFWQTEVYGPWHFCRRYLYSAAQRLAEIGSLQTGGPLGQRTKQRLVINVHLQRPVAHAFRCLGRKRQHWRAVKEGGADPGARSEE